MSLQTPDLIRARSKPRAGLPNRLRSLRIAHGLTLQAVADYLGVSPQAIYKAETTSCGINRHKWYRLADLFETDPRILEQPE